MASPKILKAGKWRNENQPSPKDEDIEKIGDQKLKNEGSEGEKDHIALVIEKGCNYLS